MFKLIKVSRYEQILFLGIGKFSKYFVITKPKFLKRFSINDGICFSYGRYEENWKLLKIGGYPQKPFDTGCDYDCSGRTFCNYVNSYLNGFITIGYYGIDI